MEKNVAIVHYNTPELTKAVIMSVWKHTPDCKITLLDNSDKLPFPKMKGVKVLDNTKGQIINFEAWLARFSDKVPTLTNWGSEKHIISVDYLFSLFPKGFLLLDSDALIKSDVSDFFDESVAWKGEVEYKPKFWFQAQRLSPVLLWINVPMCRRVGIRFAHDGRIYKVSHKGAPYYDTGSSFYHDVKGAELPTCEVALSDYVEHLGGASYKETAWAAWLEEHKDLYL